MAFDAKDNFAYSSVATAPSPAASGTSLVLAAGEGARFPDPAVDGEYNIVVWQTGVQPLSANAEIVRVTARSTDTLTITREQEGTSARTIVVGDQVALNITKKTFTDYEDVLTNSFYTDQSGGTSDTYGALSGTINGSNTTFTVSESEYISGSLTVYLNGQLQTQGSGEDWVENTPGSGTFDFNTAPVSGDEITVVYLKTSTASTHNADTVDSIHAADSPSDGKLIADYAGWQKAGDTFTYAAADAPTYTVTITGDKTSKYSAGMKIKLTQPTDGVKYYIIVKVAYSSPNTTLTLYGGTDYDLDNEAITSPYYSCMRAPHGFPLAPSKWTVEVTDSTTRSQGTPTANVWYNLGSISINIPIGVWNVRYEVMLLEQDTVGSAIDIEVTLSTANNSESDSDWTVTHEQRDSAGPTLRYSGLAIRENEISIATKDTYYLNTRTTDTGLVTIDNRNLQTRLVIRAICAYL